LIQTEVYLGLLAGPSSSSTTGLACRPLLLLYHSPGFTPALAFEERGCVLLLQLSLAESQEKQFD